MLFFSNYIALDINHYYNVVFRNSSKFYTVIWLNFNLINFLVIFHIHRVTFKWLMKENIKSAAKIKQIKSNLVLIESEIENN